MAFEPTDSAPEDHSLRSRRRTAVRPTGPIVVADPKTVPGRKPRIARPGRLALQLLGVAAVGATLLVNMVDPYSGVVASQYFTVAVSNPQNLPTQSYAGGTDLAASVTRDGYDITAPPPPPPPPPVVVAAAAPSSSTSNAKTGSGSDEGSDSNELSAQSSSAFAPPADPPDPGSAQAYAQQALAAYGWGAPEEYDCLVALWNRESGWRYNAYNPSGAYGIPQALPGSKMASAGADWETNPNTQIDWGLSYITKYGSPCGAWAQSEAEGWY